MIIDKILYWLLPATIHEWGATNRAKVRSYALAAVLAAGPKLVELLPEEHETLALSLGSSFLAYVTGRSIHSVVEPWNEEQ